jgi:ATP-binding cassette subfamily B (MDR/TAP) protein 1
MIAKRKMAPNLDGKTGQLNEAFVGDEINSKTSKSNEDTNSSLGSVDDNKKKKKGKKKEKEPKPELPPVSFFALFRFASGTDWFLVTLAMLAAAATGTL